MLHSIDTPRLRLVLESTETVLARIAAMTPDEQAQVSPQWLERVRTTAPHPWTHGFAIVERETDEDIGMAAFKGPPDDSGSVEIAYGVNPDRQGRGYAREAAAALTRYALGAGARAVHAHTLPVEGVSPRVLEACGFVRVGEVVDPEDGLVWRWEYAGTSE